MDIAERLPGHLHFGRNFVTVFCAFAGTSSCGAWYTGSVEVIVHPASKSAAVNKQSRYSPAFKSVAEPLTDAFIGVSVPMFAFELAATVQDRSQTVCYYSPFHSRWQ
jgi:hypothetical protein